jgi:hypothetical protein
MDEQKLRRRDDERNPRKSSGFVCSDAIVSSGSRIY